MGLVQLKSDEEIELIRESYLLVGKTLAEVAKHIQPGVTPLELDKLADEFIHDNGASPTFKGYNGFPNALCISPNEVVVHGIPGKKALRDGDIVSIDCGVYKNGFHGDSAFTFEVGEVSDEIRDLLRVTKESLYLGIEQAVAGNRIGDIGYAIQNHAEEHGYGVVRELVGHGLGRDLHEAPEVPNYGKRGRGKQLQEGMVLAIEPMINLDTKKIRQERDGWTIVTKDLKVSAHFEHDVAIRKGEPDVLSTFSFIEEVLNSK